MAACSMAAEETGSARMMDFALWHPNDVSAYQEDVEDSKNRSSIANWVDQHIDELYDEVHLVTFVDGCLIDRSTA